MKVVIAGGTGFLGQPLAEALAADGREVVVLTRGDARQKALGVRRKIAKPADLPMVGDLPSQKRPRQGWRRGPPEPVAPLEAQPIEIERSQIQIDRIMGGGASGTDSHDRLPQADATDAVSDGVDSAALSGAVRSTTRYVLVPSSPRDLSIAKPRLRRPVNAARVVCGSHPVTPTSESRVAPVEERSMPITRACFDPACGRANAFSDASPLRSA